MARCPSNCPGDSCSDACDNATAAGEIIDSHTGIEVVGCTDGAVLTLLAVTGLTHKQAYGGTFAITLIKTLAVAVVISVFYLTGIV